MTNSNPQSTPPEEVELEEILDEILEPNTDDETPEGLIRNYRTLVLHDSEFQARQEKAVKSLLRWREAYADKQVGETLWRLIAKTDEADKFGKMQVVGRGYINQELSALRKQQGGLERPEV